MENFGFIRVAAAIPELKVADCAFNREKIECLIQKAIEREVQIVCFPELSISGYTCGDLLGQQLLLEQVEEEVMNLLQKFANSDIIFIVGVPVRVQEQIIDAAFVCQSGKIAGIISQKECKNSNVEYAGQIIPFGTDLLFGNFLAAFAIEIGSNLWGAIPSSSYHALNGAYIVFNLAANGESAGKYDYLKSLIQQQSSRCMAGYVYASAGYGESTTDAVFAGNAFIYENGKLLSETQRFLFEEQLIINEIDIDRLKSERQNNSLFVSETTDYYRKIELQFLPIIYQSALTRIINPKPFLPEETAYNERCEEIFSIQIGGLAKRLLHTQVNTAVIGVSGGLDSTLALLVAVKTFDKLGFPRKNIIGITMPGFGTTGRTYNNALSLMQSLGITIKEISIVAACKQHFEDIGHDMSVHDAVYENAQARERTQILMDVANQINGLVVGTGDLSELALGWATYNGDHISMYGVNAGVPKTLIRHLVKWVAEMQVDEKSATIIRDIIDTPVSPELLPADNNGDISQKTEDIVGPYELHDFFLYYTVRFGFPPRKIFFLAQNAFKDLYDDEIILKWMEVFFRRFFSQQFKRSCMPDGPKVGSVNLSPRGDWKMPSDASSALWIKEIDGLKNE